MSNGAQGTHICPHIPAGCEYKPKAPHQVAGSVCASLYLPASPPLASSSSLSARAMDFRPHREHSLMSATHGQGA